MNMGRLPGLLSGVWLLVAISLPVASSLARSIDPLRINGKEYVRLADWAAANNFSVRWTQKDEALQLSGSARLELQVHSPEAQLNGVKVRLLFPVAQHDNSVYLSRADVQTFAAVLSPPRSRTKIKTICLDPGHGGKDPGFSVGSNQEKKYTLLLAKEVQDQLVHAGFKVSLTRTYDNYVERAERPDLARRRNADLFISLHFNATEGSAKSVQGVEVYCLTPAGAPSSNSGGEGGGAGWFAGNRHNDENTFLAYQLQKALTRELPAEDRGVHRARFEVLREATMPAVLIEGGFMSHPTEGKKIFTPTYRKQMARAIFDGVAAYKAAVER
jgi:N-acetylmuramoyl-L-alanine amidase